MSTLVFHDLSPTPMVLSLILHFALGGALGTLYFRAIWRSARLFSEDGRPAAAIGLLGGRILVMGGVLLLTSLEGAQPLLAAALGFLTARFVIVRAVEGSIH